MSMGVECVYDGVDEGLAKEIWKIVAMPNGGMDARVAGYDMSTDK